MECWKKLAFGAIVIALIVNTLIWGHVLADYTIANVFLRHRIEVPVSETVRIILYTGRVGAVALVLWPLAALAIGVPLMYRLVSKSSS